MYEQGITVVDLAASALLAGRLLNQSSFYKVQFYQSKYVLPKYVLPKFVLPKSVLPKYSFLRMEFYNIPFYQGPVPPKSRFAGMCSTKVRFTKVHSTKVRICWSVVYQSPFYQSLVLPKSCLLQIDILPDSFLVSTKVRLYQSPFCFVSPITRRLRVAIVNWLQYITTMIDLGTITLLSSLNS
jgi:hypothetical protein